jgi:lysophospholipase L1-like esterase
MKQALALLFLVAACGTPSRGLRIMPLGDSITAGDDEHDSYRRPLFKSLELEGHSVNFVGSLRSRHLRPDFDADHEGHWGFRVDEILEEVRGWVEAEEPDILLVHLGSNDVFQEQSIASTIDELGQLIGTVRESRPNALFLVAQIIPTVQGPNDAIRELNASIPSLASKSTARSPVRIVDLYTGFYPGRMTYDGVHPNAEGEIHMADRWLAAVESYLTYP